MIITGYLLSSIMGFVLGTIGAGGSILILPILVYFIGINPTLATSYSLVIVGLTALIGSLTYIKNKQINFTITFIFAIPSLITVYLTRRYFLPILPDNINLFNNDILCMTFNLIQNSITLYMEEIFKFFPLFLSIEFIS